MSKLDLAFADKLKEIDLAGTQEWISVYCVHKTDQENFLLYGCLISEERKPRALSVPSWDLHLGDGFPGFCSAYKNGERIDFYSRHSQEGVEPLILFLNHHGIKPDGLEISEEFRHYFQLFDDSANGKYIYIDRFGNEEDAIRKSENRIEIKTRLLREFLSAKNMEISLQFDFMRLSQDEVENLGLKETLDKVTTPDRVFQIQITNLRNFSSDKGTQGCLLGKRIIKGQEDKKFRGTEEDQFMEFIIGIGSDCKEIQFTCKESKLSNYFGANPGAPSYLTPIFFKKTVLNKYYAEPDKYKVVDGNLFCGSLWSLSIDNNHSDYIAVFLGDLSRLTYLEQMHWRIHNVAVQEKISRTSFERNIKGQFFDPEKADLIFKQNFNLFNNKWVQKFGWRFFREMSPNDLHHFTTLRIPMTNEQSEFDQQVLSLTKIMIDSLNEFELAKNIALKENDKGISKLKAFLESSGANFSEEIQFLRNLQDLRSAGAVHLKGSRYEKCKPFFLIGMKDLSKVFEDILDKTIQFLEKLEATFLN